MELEIDLFILLVLWIFYGAWDWIWTGIFCIGRYIVIVLGTLSDLWWVIGRITLETSLFGEDTESISIGLGFYILRNCGGGNYYFRYLNYFFFPLTLLGIAYILRVLLVMLILAIMASHTQIDAFFIYVLFNNKIYSIFIGLLKISALILATLFKSSLFYILLKTS